MFDIVADNFATILILLVVMWILQFGSAFFQYKHFYGRMGQLRKSGTTAVGLMGGRYKGRNYAVLTVDAHNTVIHAEKFSGWTVFAKLRPVPALVGLSLDQILDEQADLPVSKKMQHAFRDAAGHIVTAQVDSAENGLAV